MDKQVQVRELYHRINDLFQLRLWDAVKAACEELLRISPEDGFAWYCLGEIALASGNVLDGVHALRNAVTYDPPNLHYWRSFAVALQKQGEWSESIKACRRILRTDSRDVTTWSMLAAAEATLGRLSDAETVYERCVKLAPDRNDIAVDYGNLLCRRGRPDRALVVLQDVVARDRKFAPAWVALGGACVLLAKWSDAASACETALRLESNSIQARFALATALMRLWRLPDAEMHAREILRIDPRNADAWSLLGNLLKMQGRTPEATSQFQRAADISQRADNHSDLLIALQYLEDQTPESLLAAHQKWAATHTNSIRVLSHPPVARRAAARRIKLGFVSGDFGVQVTSYLALPLFEALDRTQCSVTCYSDRLADDALTLRFRAAADRWCDTGRWETSNIVDQIRTDEIDILIDLMGHTGDRLAVFASKPAPMQVTWLGYVGTTGLPTMDFLLADRFHVRPGEESGYVEQVLRMPNGYVCYSPIFPTLEPSPLPALTRGFVTFGCFNNPAKYSSSMFDAWATILRGAPSTRLLLKFGGLDHSVVEANLRRQFENRGVAPERILFEGWSPALEMLARYHEVDLALDTQPYSGGVTTCEALWMGVPVITFPGRTFAGRHSTSHLTNAGYPQFVAPDLAGYIDLAVSWANRLDELATIRSQMRERVRNSPLCDAPTFARDLLNLLQLAWHTKFPT